ncbi:MAG: hypothetical protein WA137_11545 [Methanothrix sp.]
MKTRNLLAVFCLIGLAITAILASDETVLLASGEPMQLGPANVSLNLSLAGSYVLEKGESSELEHDYDKENTDFKYSIYPATATYEGTTDHVQIEVHEISISRPLDGQISGKMQISPLEHCIEQSDMMPRRADYEEKSCTIDGHEGILLTINAGENDPSYIAAYSPDEKDGSGSIICIIGSDFPWETTENIIDSVKTQIT